MCKKQITYFSIYLACIVLIPTILFFIANTIPKNDSLSPTGHSFDYLDDKAFFIGLVLNFGLYLYPLHFIFLNKTTLTIPRKLFLSAVIFTIFLPPTMLIVSTATMRKDSLIFMSYIALAFVIPFLIIYYIKHKICKW